ncbi:MAG: hypothetical protein WAN72_00345 [Candidatus Acidiferrales bacterium]
MRWIGYAVGALAAAYLLNLVAFFMLLHGLEYHASSFRHAVADVGVVILYPGTALSRDKIDPFVTGTFAWGAVIFAFLAFRERKASRRRLAQRDASFS